MVISLYFEQWTSRNVFQTFQKSNILDSNNKSSHGDNKKVENSSLLDNSIQTIKPHSKEPPSSEWQGSLYGHNASATNSHSKRKQGTKVGKSHKLLILLLRVTKDLSANTSCTYNVSSFCRLTNREKIMTLVPHHLHQQPCTFQFRTITIGIQVS